MGDLDYEVFELGDVELRMGATLRAAKLAFKRYGTLNEDRSNAILYPTWYSGQHVDNEWLIGEGMALDPTRWCIIVPNMLGNGLSSSPSNTPPPYDRARFPQVTVQDNVAVQHRLVTEHLGIERLELVTGWSMGAGQTFQWAVSHPEMVKRIAPFCGSARTSRHNIVFLEGVKAALTADAAFAGGWYDAPPTTGLRAVGRVYAGWGLSQAFYWDERYRELGYSSLEDFLVGYWEGFFLTKDANNLLTMLWTWQHGDVGLTPGFDGDTARALASIKAKAIVMPAEKDLYFPPEDEAWEVSHMPNAELRVIPGAWGHFAGGGSARSTPPSSTPRCRSSWPRTPDAPVPSARVIARASALQALTAESFDVVVVGGGITGAGCALDAAARGSSVALVEKRDFAAGTSSRSSKLVHGGLRYLQSFDLGLVREALLERQLMVTLAPHLVHPLKLVVPAFEGASPDRLVGVGLNLYDVMSRGRRRRGEFAESWSPDRHRTIDGDEVVALLPALASRRPTSGYLFYDCQTDDVRLVLTVLGEAERFGAVLANRVEVTELVDGGVAAVDTETGEPLRIRAANVINATGVWADRLRPGELRDEADIPQIRPSRGTHVTLAHETLPLQAGAIVPAAGGRFIFALPWLGRTLLGTTDNDYDGELDFIAPDAADVDYILDAANQFFDTSLTAADLTGAYAGVRPLISSGDPKKSVDISRKAELYETSSMITITGGKLTTWRRMAKMAVDRLVERDGRDAPCRTHEIPLGQAVDPAALPRVAGVADDAYAALAARYGHVAHDVLRVAAERGELAAPIVDGLPDLLAEAVHAVRHDQARSLGDVLLRRTRLGLLAAREVTAEPVARRLAQALALELGWDDVRVDAEMRRFAEEAEAEGIVGTVP